VRASAAATRELLTLLLTFPRSRAEVHNRRRVSASVGCHYFGACRVERVLF